jgi:hypothetical protein
MYIPIEFELLVAILALGFWSSFIFSIAAQAVIARLDTFNDPLGITLRERLKSRWADLKFTLKAWPRERLLSLLRPLTVKPAH